MIETKQVIVRTSPVTFRQTYAFIMDKYALSPWPTEFALEDVIENKIGSEDSELWIISSIYSGEPMWITTTPEKLPLMNSEEVDDLETLFDAVGERVDSISIVPIDRYVEIAGLSLDAYLENKGWNSALIPLAEEESNEIEVVVEVDKDPAYKIIVNGRAFGEFDNTLDDYRKYGIVDLLSGQIVWLHTEMDGADQDDFLRAKLHALLKASQIAWSGDAGVDIDSLERYKKWLEYYGLVY